jgi:hypothetical protein
VPPVVPCAGIFLLRVVGVLVVGILILATLVAVDVVPATGEA